MIGCEYASIFAALGVRVTLIDKRSRLLPHMAAFDGLNRLTG